ncbi:type VI secretion system protein TssA [Pseudomonas huanghezhanensis]|uniref:type VI secretion system protein TssA n=1 Tax=Pseudomonas huanghezhanensis TaxID=3002903 RepID=UPI0022857BA3|nr:type VI secretion system protein TssA [Pseudomonas sp. BSw22131]
MDVSLLLSPVSESFPCGEDLEYDADFLQLERDAAGKPERAMGDSVQPAQPPQWQLVRQTSVALLKRSKDLRVAHRLLQSHLALEGIPGLAVGLLLVYELLCRYWPVLHPQLDCDDQDDPTIRINALSAIACDTTLRLLGASLLIRSPVFGSVSLRAAMNASGLQSFSDQTLSGDELAAALRSSDPQALRDMHFALSESQRRAAAIEACVSEHVSSAHGVDLSALKTALKHALSILGDVVPQHASGRSAHPVEIAAETLVSTLNTPSAPVDIANRTDVLRCLDSVLRYYGQHEPSSPLPVLLNRAKSLVHADFAAVVRNLIPDGTSQLENLRGPQSD